MIDLNAITQRSAGPSWGWYRYGTILCFGKEDHECAVGIIFEGTEEAYDIFGCWAPGIPPMDDDCIFFRDKNGEYIDEQDAIITDRALAALPRTSGRMDGIILGPSIESNPVSSAVAATNSAPLPQTVALIGIGVIVVGGLTFLLVKALS